MTKTLEILYGVSGQSIYLDATEGRPSSITSASVYNDTAGDDDTSEAATSGSASVEINPNTTFDANSGESSQNRRTCNLTATTGIAIGRSYLAENATGEKEWIEVTEISAGVSVTSRSPLHNDFVSGDTFQSTRMTINIDDTWASDKSNISDDLSPHPGYRVRWVYVVDSKTYVKDSYFDLVRYQGSHSVTPADMEKFLPSWRNILPTYHREDNGRALIDEAYRQIQVDFYANNRPDEMIRDREIVDELVKNKARELLLYQRYFESGAGPEIALEANRQYQARLDALIVRTSKVPFATDSGGSSTEITPPSIWSK